MDNLCMSIPDMIAFLTVMESVIVNAVRIDDYIIIQNLTHMHAYEEIHGQVCHVLGYNIWNGEIIRHPRGAEL